MNSSNPCNSFSLDELFKFKRMVVLDYYDGPEAGVLTYESDQDIVRFHSLADSRSRMFRAYELARIRRTRNFDVEKLEIESGVDSHIWQAIFSAPAKETYLAIGRSNFTKMRAIVICDNERLALHSIRLNDQVFEGAHRLLKDRLR